MRFQPSVLRSRVGRRIVKLFILCALVPILSLAVLSYRQVNRQLLQQGRIRIRQTCKLRAMAVFERLLIIESELQSLASLLESRSPLRAASPPLPSDGRWRGKFQAIHFLRENEPEETLFGSESKILDLSSGDKSGILAGTTGVFPRPSSDRSMRIVMALAADRSGGGRGILMAEIVPEYLWFMGYENALPPMAELLVFDRDRKLIYSSLPLSEGALNEIREEIAGGASGFVEWAHGDENHLAAYRDLFLQSRFMSSKWILVLSEPTAYFGATVTYFKRTFPFVILLSLWVVVLLSVSQIRRSLVPLEQLREGALRVAGRDFDSRVRVQSGDEFESLANSFNAMSQALGKQFKTLELIAEVDGSVLSGSRGERIVDTLLTRIHRLFPCRRVGVTMFDPAQPTQGKTYFRTDPLSQTIEAEVVGISPGEGARLLDAEGHLFLDDADSVPDCLSALTRGGSSRIMVFPVILQDKLAGLISLGFDTNPILAEDDIHQVRQLVDRVGVALSNTRLVRELKDFNRGTLIALARAIDAKSHWTAGHSERGTRIALEIGHAMRLSPPELNIIQQGGLLHDIGKLGIPNAILDKPGRLTRKERKVIQTHPRLGAGILEPIAAYSDVIRIVREHHENFNGSGYPEGLAGEEISLYSRIFSIADCFEALTSGRPYRRRLRPAQAAAAIRAAAGTKYDPEVVTVFLGILSRKPEGFEDEAGVPARRGVISS